MNRKIRFASIFLCLVLLVAFCGCKSNEATSSDTKSVPIIWIENSSKIMSSEVTSSKNEEMLSKPTSSVKPTVSKESETSSKGEQKVDWRKEPEKYKLIAFTLDDAPTSKGGRGTVPDEMMSIFEEYEGRATFFVSGSRIDSFSSEQLTLAVGRGFELGNHTYEHKDVEGSGASYTVDTYREDIVKCQNIVKEKTGVIMKYLRPSGAHSNEVVYAVAKELNLPIIYGNRGGQMAADWDHSVSAEEIAEGIRKSTYDGAILLMHAWNEKTLAALRETLPELYEDGYRFCTLSELFAFKGLDYNTLPKNAPIYGIDSYSREPQTTAFK